MSEPTAPATPGHGVPTDNASRPLAGTTAWLPGIDVLRGIAAGAVVVAHAFALGELPGVPGNPMMLHGLGSWGVGMFFVLSGYLLCDYFWRPRTQRSLKVFWVRRIFRVAPAYYVQVALLFLFFASPVLLMSGVGLRQVLAQLTFTHFFHPSTTPSFNVNGALWTLSIEAMLYLAMPLLALAVGWPAVRGRRALLAPMAAVAALIAVSIGYRLFVAYHGAGLQSLYFGDIAPEAAPNARFYLSRQFPGWLGLFAMGIGLRWLVHQRHLPDALLRPTRHRVSTFGLLLLPSLAWLAVTERSAMYTHPFLFATFDVVLGALLLPALLYAARPSSTDEGTATIRAGVWLGDRSYGLYLWHFPVILVIFERGSAMLPPDNSHPLIRLALVGLVALTLAAVSYRFIELPAREYGRRLSRRIADRQASAAAVPAPIPVPRSSHEVATTADTSGAEKEMSAL
jgi:peptidoglycan/LPS O-acetylase OafA/YrhL